MTISSEITKLINNLAACYTKCTNKGATIPQDENFDNLADCINSIPTANLTSLSVTPSTTAQTLTPLSPYNGFNQVDVNAVTADIDSNITAGNIKSGVSILGVSGTLSELNGTTTSITPTTSSQTVTPDSPYNGFTSVTVPAVTSSIDANITAGNIKKDVQILGVTGTYEGSGGSSIGIPREISANGTFQMPSSNFTFSLPSNAADVNDNAMQYAFCRCNNLTSVDLSNLTNLSGDNALSHAFDHCTSLTSVDLSNLTNLSGDNALSHAFDHCTSLTSVDLSNLTNLSGNNAMQYAFSTCTSLTSVDFSNLEQIGLDTASTNYGQFRNCFEVCDSLTTLNFPKLEKIYCTGTITSHGTFYNCDTIKKMYFPKLDTITYGTGAPSSSQAACQRIFSGCYSLTELHFAAANQAAIQASAGYSTVWGLGAGYATIYFDL